MSDPIESAGAIAGAPPLQGWRAAFPPAQWLPAYWREWPPHDAVAGVTLAAYATPASLAYASLAGLPTQYEVTSIESSALRRPRCFPRRALTA